MATNTPHSKSRVALRGLAITVATLCLYPCSPTTPATASTTGERPTSSYGWPIKPFHSQHPVRGFFGDPRVDWEIPNVRRMYRFHFGVDVSAPDGTAVYATTSGRITVQSEAVVVTRADGVELEYWHVVPTVRTGDRATAYRTVVGRIAHGWEHVHFSERRAGTYVNPLRLGAMGPYEDTTAPVVRGIRLQRGLHKVNRFRVAGRVSLVANCFDVTPVAVPAPWNGKPVTPALVRWRLTGPRGAVFGWRTAVDFRLTIPSYHAYHHVYASGTRQNRSYLAGQYYFLLAKGWNSDSVADGVYSLEVAVADAAGNTARRSQRVVISNHV
jgi:hypothetical protein